ncbi:MAG: hypothetical protein MK189_07065, partial [Acidimicrobiales bacterium]|nr:hypothetical protein [Acidimicrobiales bacterium]
MAVAPSTRGARGRAEGRRGDTRDNPDRNADRSGGPDEGALLRDQIDDLEVEVEELRKRLVDAPRRLSEFEVELRDAKRELARAMCDRLRGVGGDGLILFHADGERFVMTIINSDGSPAEISGNGLRCLGAYLSHAGLATGPEIEVSTGAGLLKLMLLGRNDTTFRF